MTYNQVPYPVTDPNQVSIALLLLTFWLDLRTPASAPFLKPVTLGVRPRCRVLTSAKDNDQTLLILQLSTLHAPLPSLVTDFTQVSLLAQRSMILPPPLNQMHVSATDLVQILLILLWLIPYIVSLILMLRPRCRERCSEKDKDQVWLTLQPLTFVVRLLSLVTDSTQDSLISQPAVLIQVLLLPQLSMVLNFPYLVKDFIHVSLTPLPIERTQIPLIPQLSMVLPGARLRDVPHPGVDSHLAADARVGPCRPDAPHSSGLRPDVGVGALHGLADPRAASQLLVLLRGGQQPGLVDPAAVDAASSASLPRDGLHPGLVDLPAGGAHPGLVDPLAVDGRVLHGLLGVELLPGGSALPAIADPRGCDRPPWVDILFGGGLIPLGEVILPGFARPQVVGDLAGALPPPDVLLHGVQAVVDALLAAPPRHGAPLAVNPAQTPDADVRDVCPRQRLDLDAPPDVEALHAGPFPPDAPAQDGPRPVGPRAEYVGSVGALRARSTAFCVGLCAGPRWVTLGPVLRRSWSRFYVHRRMHAL